MIEGITIGGRRFLVPEVIQASAMDCGPAALYALLEGFGVRASYAGLQQACQTDLDGTSINTLEELGRRLGLDAEQVMVPIDHMLLESAKAIPALAVVTRDRTTHFVVLWRRHGAFVQLMDPAKGRRWLRSDALRDELYIHEQAVPASAFRAWAASPEFLDSVIGRLRRLRVGDAVRGDLVTTAVADQSWRSLSLLDAGTRMVAELVHAAGLRAGDEAGRVLETIAVRARVTTDLCTLVPDRYWFALGGDNDDVITLRGAVLLRVRGRRVTQEEAGAAEKSRTSMPPPTPAHIIPEVSAHPLLEMWRLVVDKQPMIPALLCVGVIVAAAGALFEVMWLRGLLEMSNVLTLRGQRVATVALLLATVGALTVLDVAISSALLRLGRRAEARLRAAQLTKLPRIGEGYFQRRLVSDLAQRAHSIDALRGIPDVAGRFARSSMQLAFTAIGLAWLDPPSAGIAIAAAVFVVAIPLATERMLAERELRQRSHAAALTRHYLDSLLGLFPARVHAAERPLRHQHERLLVEWGRSSLDLVRGSVMVEGAQLLVGSLLAAWLVLGFVARGARPGSTLLFVYWALTLPLLARELAGTIRQFPAYRNILSRVLEPLRAPDEAEAVDGRPPARSTTGVAITLRSVQVRIGGRRVLDVDLTIGSGEHVAIVGRSGAGKSTLVGLMLGWRAPTRGTLVVDGEPLDPRRLAALRRETAWVDPAVHLWNRSFFDNLRYGDRGTIVSSIGSIIEEANLGEVLEKMPSGLQSPLGEGGRLTSGGEGQRIRFGRALVRRTVRLAILDEPFRGLDRQRRHELLTRARAIWREQTMLCVTHDIQETLSFERVLVLHEGRVVEDGNPVELSRAAGSVYASMLKAEEDAQTTLWTNGRWRRWRLENGVVCEEDYLQEPSWTIERQISPGR